MTDDGRVRLGRSRGIGEGLATLGIWLISLLVTGMFCWILYDLVRYGARGLSPSFLLDDPRDAGRDGGIAPILVSTLAVLTVCMLVACPIGMGAAIYLAEFTSQGSPLGRIIRRSLDVLAAVPSIVFGLFGCAFFCIWMGLGFSILSGGLTLACMVLPLFIRIAEVGLRSVPAEYRQAGAALGISRSAILFKVVLPSAVPSLTAGFVLSIARAMAETAALVFTSGYVDRMPESLFDSGRVIAVHILDLSMNVPGGDRNACATALVLIGILILINVAVTRIGWGSAGGGRPA